MKTSSKSSAPLLEIAIAAVIFAVAGGFILNMFLSASYTQKAAFDKTQAANLAVSYMETAMAEGQEKSEKLFFNADWQECGEDEGVYTLTLDCTLDGEMLSGSAEVVKNDGYPFVNTDYSQLFFTDFKHLVIE